MSSPATSSRLPQELVDTVIDEFRNDVASLRACSLVSKPWVYRSRKHLFATVHLPTCLLRRWLERVPATPASPLDVHHSIRSLFLQPASPSAAFCIPETFADHLSSFTQLSGLAFASSLREEWTDAFSDSALVAKYFGSLGRSLRKLELTRVHLDMVALQALLDVFPRLEQILIFSPIMTNEESKSVEAFPHLQERQNITEAEGPSNAVVPRKNITIRWVDSVSLFFPPRELVTGLANSPLRCRELVLADDSDYSEDTLNLLVDSTGPTLESLVIRNTFGQGNPIPSTPYIYIKTSPFLTTIGISPGSTVTLETCPILRKLRTKAPYSGMLAYIDDQARLIRTVTSPFLTQIVFLGKWDDSQMDRSIDWLEPVNWETVDRELCDLMSRLDEEVKLEVVFADGGLPGSHEDVGASYERADGAHRMLLDGVKRRGGIVKIQQGEEVSKPSP